ncbi:MAG: PQQ-binding-like beta-propeller repeat protein [Candidatus Poseidoniaceae archaeon]|nr:PQQ-binding-like beta-propeller repeat protein [Candidatus Poseidoniaceae archaeon]
MKRVVLLSLLLFLLPFAKAESNHSWEHEFENGYITTQPLLVEDSVFVRTSGFWMGDERPQVSAFEISSGDELWTYRSETTLQHDMSPLMFVEAGSGVCGVWQDVLIVAWADGKVTALNPSNGELVWEQQTEVNVLGITGKLGIDGDRVVVPTRQGLSTFCLDDGAQLLRVEFEEMGWRNGVLVSESGYHVGTEVGVLYSVNRDGTMTNSSIGDGKIRHAPIETQHGLLIHLQTATGSVLYLNNSIIGNYGFSPAIPLQFEDHIFLATSNEWVSLSCNNITCLEESRSSFHSNGEMSMRTLMNDSIEIWVPSNTPNGGWGVFNRTSLQRMHTTSFDSYTTAAPGFSSTAMALGNDMGLLQVTVFDSDETIEQESTFSLTEALHYVLLLLSYLLCCLFFATDNKPKLWKALTLFLLLFTVAAVPEISAKWPTLAESDTEAAWDIEWPEEWRDTQIVVIEIDGTENVIGGLSGHSNVYELTQAATLSLGISTEYEDQYLGLYLLSFNGTEGDGWEFTIDGSRSNTGIVDTTIDSDSILRWRPA